MALKSRYLKKIFDIFVLGFAPEGGSSLGIEVHAGRAGRQLPRVQRRCHRSPVPGGDREEDGEVSGLSVRVWLGFLGMYYETFYSCYFYCTVIS